MNNTQLRIEKMRKDMFDHVLITSTKSTNSIIFQGPKIPIEKWMMTDVRTYSITACSNSKIYGSTLTWVSTLFRVSERSIFESIIEWFERINDLKTTHTQNNSSTLSLFFSHTHKNPDTRLFCMKTKESWCRYA